jgi:hypothetical protein
LWGTLLVLALYAMMFWGGALTVLFSLPGRTIQDPRDMGMFSNSLILAIWFSVCALIQRDAIAWGNQSEYSLNGKAN